MTALALLTGLSLLVWAYLIFLHDGFWHADLRLPESTHPAAIAAWPEVTVLVPARDEAAVISRSISSLLTQDYPGTFRVLLIDDHSSDGTEKHRQASGSRFEPKRRALTVTLGWRSAPGLVRESSGP